MVGGKGEYMKGKQIILINTKDNGKNAVILKEIKPDVFRIKLENGVRTVVHRIEFKEKG